MTEAHGIEVRVGKGEARGGQEVREGRGHVTCGKGGGNGGSRSLSVTGAFLHRASDQSRAGTSSEP